MPRMPDPVWELEVEEGTITWHFYPGEPMTYNHPGCADEVEILTMPEGFDEERAKQLAFDYMETLARQSREY